MRRVASLALAFGAFDVLIEAGVGESHGCELMTILFGGGAGCQTIPNRTQVEHSAMLGESQGPLVGTAPGRVRKGY